MSNIIVNSTSSQLHVLLAIPVIVTLNPLINCDVPGKQHGSGHNLDDELLLDELLKLLDGLLLDGLLELDEGLLELDEGLLELLEL